MSRELRVCIGSMEQSTLVGGTMLEIDHIDYLQLYELPGLRVTRELDVSDVESWFDPTDLLHDLAIMSQHLEEVVSEDGEFAGLAMDVQPEIEILSEACTNAAKREEKIGLYAI